MTSVLAPYHVPHAVMQTILGSVGGAPGRQVPGWRM